MKVCCVFNYNSFYRFPIYYKMGKELKCDFFFGDTCFQKIKPFDTNFLPGFIDTIHAKKLRIGGLVWYSNTAKIFKRKYTHYIVTGEPRYLINWLILIYAKLTGKKVLMWTHGILNKSFIVKKPTRLFYSYFFQMADTILQYGEHPTPIMEEIGCQKDKIKYIHNSLDTALHTHIYNSITESDIYLNHFNNNNPVVIYIGRIQTRKRVGQLVDAVEILRDKGIMANIVIVGGKTDDDELYRKIDSCNHDGHIWLYGPCYNEEKNAELLYNASVCVCPAEVGLTAIHSLSFGTPVVSNDNFDEQMPEFESIIPNQTGSFFKENDVEDLANHIYRWVTVSNNERQNIRDLSRNEILEKWSVDYQISLLRNVLN